MDYNVEKIRRLEYKIERYKIEQALWEKKHWQYGYFQNRIDEAQLEIQERKSLVEKLRGN